MNQQLSFEEYKQKVRECLRTKRNCSTQETERLMKLYEEDFPEFYRDNWSVLGAASAMIFGM